MILVSVQKEKKERDVEGSYVGEFSTLILGRQIAFGDFSFFNLKLGSLNNNYSCQI